MFKKITLVLFIVSMASSSTMAGDASRVRSHKVIPSTALSTDRVRPLPDSPIQRYHIDRNGGRVIDGDTAGATGTLVYKNTLGANFFAPGTNIQIADDILTIASGGCDMSFLEVQVTGGGNGSGPGFTANFALLTACPTMGGTVIPGTTLTEMLPNNGQWMVTLDLEGMEVAIPENPWLRMSFSNATAGWVFGSPAEVGFTESLFHHPMFPCTAWFGPTPPNPYSGFYAEIRCSGDVQTQFEAYRAHAFSGFVELLGPNDLWADDIMPITSPETCDLARYDSDIAGLMGNYSIRIELYTNDANDTTPMAPIMGTSQTCNGAGGGAVATCTKTVFPAITIPTADFWVSYDLLTGQQAGPILVGDFPEVGFSIDGYAIFGNPDVGQWSPAIHGYGGCPGVDGMGDPVRCGTFQNTIYCAGSTPSMGVCCEFESTCSITSQRDCKGTSWIMNGTCDPNPCPVLSSCCRDDGSCTNSEEQECNDGTWMQGQSCTTNPCPPGGSCCGNDGLCATTTEANCLSGAWTMGGLCSPNPCSQPGSCCLKDGSCTVTFQNDCKGTWTISGQCVPNNCPQLGSCCANDGTCEMTLQSGCATADWTEGEICSPNICPQPGSCCEGPGVCSITLFAECAGVWVEGETCALSPCLTPVVANEVGARYVSITVEPTLPLQPLALRIISPDLPCLDAYVGTGGLVDSAPLFQTPAAWGTVFIGDAEIIPSTTYYVQTETQNGMSGVISATTWRWGDTNNDTIIDLDDILCVLAAFSGNYSPTCTLYGADLIGGFFNPDRVVNLDDILAVLGAFSGAQYPGPYPCP